MELSRGSEWNRWDLHVHTASSYDYKYKGDDADRLLCEALRANNIKAVAITDHFIIDKDRINSLRSLAPDIVFFPGVELRTDKGAKNLHIILIFDNNIDLSNLSGDFDAIMLRNKAKSANSNDTIYWTFEDIIDFANNHDALVSIHAGKKTNGIDKEITNGIPVNEAIKSDIAEYVHFFEIGQKKDIDDYEQHVFKVIERKALIICSDSHNPNEYSTNEPLWIKADISFQGLRQCIYQPLERVFVGVIPPMLDRLNKNRQVNIDYVSAKRVDAPTNSEVNWFDFELPINPGMVAVIGNKGSGKSALSDILGHLCKCQTMSSASFLNIGRFRKLPKNYSRDYIARIQWADGEKSEELLDSIDYGTTIEDAQYLPQKYIEDVCNDIGNVFQREIDKVIFSYVDKTERGDASNLKELVNLKSKSIELTAKSDINQLQELNEQIIHLEAKKTNQYKKQIGDSKKKSEETLARHEKSKPAEVVKPPEIDADTEYQRQLNSVNEEITKVQNEIKAFNTKISEINAYINDLNSLIAQVAFLETEYNEVKSIADAFVAKYNIDTGDYSFSFETPRTFFESLLTKAEADKDEYQSKISDPDSGLEKNLHILLSRKVDLISSADSEEKAYQKYLSDLADWNQRKDEIIGDCDTEGSLVFYAKEYEYLTEQLDIDYSKLIDKREKIVRKIYENKLKLVEVYKSIYAPVQNEITDLLGSIEDNVSFQAEIYMSNPGLTAAILNFVNQKYSGIFKGQEGSHVLDRLIRATDFNDIENVLKFINQVCTASTEDLEISEKKINDKIGFYNFIFGMTYIDVNFKLKMGARSLEELSPGERGIVLLIFYLALSQESKPIIIDQPEDNLDNQSVYSKLVPSICRAKQKRQVIIVTHNPNIAIACDAEQIIYCEMNKNTNQIHYEAGAIENPIIRSHVVDVLEGTMPAFDLRRRKYIV